MFHRIQIKLITSAKQTRSISSNNSRKKDSSSIFQSTFFSTPAKSISRKFSWGNANPVGTSFHFWHGFSTQKNTDTCLFSDLLVKINSDELLENAFERQQFTRILRTYHLPLETSYPIYKKLYCLINHHYHHEEIEDLRRVAAKLSAILGDLNLAVQYLDKLTKQLNDSNKHESLISVIDSINFPNQPEIKWNVTLWQQLARKHLLSQEFIRCFSMADQIETFVETNRAAIELKIENKIKDQHEKKIIQDWEILGLSMKDITANEYAARQIEKNRKTIYQECEAILTAEMHQSLQLVKGHFNNEYKDKIIEYKTSAYANGRREQIKQNVQEKFKHTYLDEYNHKKSILSKGKTTFVQMQLMQMQGMIKSHCNNANRHILSVHTDVATLNQYAAHAYYTHSAMNPDAAELFFKHHISQSHFELYLLLTPVNSDKLPAIKIDGATVNHPDYCIEKMNASDPRAGILGHLTGCCQSFGKQGESVVIHGITSPDSDFYVLYHKKNNQIVSQCWAWCSEQGHIIFDSIESQILYRSGDKGKVVIDLFRELARVLAVQYQLKVFVGYGGNTPKALLGPRIYEREKLHDYYGYRDSDVLHLLSGDGELEKIYQARETQAAPQSKVDESENAPCKFRMRR